MSVSTKKILTVTLNPAIDVRYMLDELNIDNVNRTTYIEKNAGGKGINVTRVLKQLGADVVATGIVGGFSGEEFVSKIKELNVEDNFLKNDVETRTCIAVIDERNKTITEILESNEQSPETFEKFLVKFESLLTEDIDYVCMSGSLPKKMNDEAYSVLLEMINKSSKKCILDTSGQSLVSSLKSKPYLIKPNRDEIEQILNFKIETEQDIIDSGKKLIDMGAENVLVSLGGEGAILVTGSKHFKFDAPKIKVKNTVGSGDSMIAGIAFTLSEGKSLEEAVKFGIICGSVNASLEKTGEIDLDMIAFFK